MTLNSRPHNLQRQHGADAGRRQRGEDRQRVHEALVEDAEHDIDGDERSNDQQRLGAQGIVKVAAVPEKDPWMDGGMPSVAMVRSTIAAASLSAWPGLRLNEIVAAAKTP